MYCRRAVRNGGARVDGLRDDFASALVLRGDPVERDERLLDHIGRRVLAEPCFQTLQQLLESFIEDELQLPAHGSSCRASGTVGPEIQIAHHETIMTQY